MGKSLVTVIISVFNQELYVEGLIESIVNQTYGYENIQLIVFEDCSTDNTLKLLERLSNLYEYAFIANNENKGFGYNINKGLEMALGKYICIAESDDVWLMDKLDQQVDYMEKNRRAAVCSGNSIEMDTEGIVLRDDQQNYYQARIYDFKDVFLKDFPFSSTCAIIRKSVIDEVGGYNEDLKEEGYYMWLKIAHAGFELHLMEAVLGFYRIDETNTIHKSMLIFIELQKILALYSDHPLYSQALKRLKMIYFPEVAKVNKKKAWRMLPSVISNTKLFYRGVYSLLGLSKAQ
jgi:alpha-1,3-rhamnosyltransferase